MPMGRGPRAALIALLLALAMPAAASAQATPRIVGGDDTTIDQYPWQAALVYDPAKVAGNPFQRQFCGGTLITPSIVLTAAHCVFDTDPDNGSNLDPNDVDVVLGQTTLSSAPASSQFSVQNVTFDPDFDPDFGPGDSDVPNKDIAYLVLQSPYTVGVTIDIAGPDEAALWDPDSNEEVTGWGATAESGPGSGGSNTLQLATVPIVSDPICAADYGVFFDSTFMVCAGYAQGGIDSCFGDSGGPMQAPLEGGGYRLVGITSWGTGCARPNLPGVYARIATNNLSATVATHVFKLETAFGLLPHEDVIGSGGQPRMGDPPGPEEPQGPGAPAGGASQPATPVARADPFAKCRRVLVKVKRKRCVKKVRRRLAAL
jgi:trypsin